MNPPAQTGAPAKKKGNGVTTPSRRGGSGRVLTDVIVDLGFVEQAAVDLAVERANDNGTLPERQLVADNTDAPGLLASLPEPAAGRTVLILGAGGAGRAAVWAMKSAGAADVAVWNRDGERAARLAADLGVRAVARPERADIVINCTSVGLVDPAATFKALPLQADELGAGSLVVDMVYRAGGTHLLEAARTRGAGVVDGLEILVNQGAASLERWTGMEAPREAMRVAATTIAET